MAGARGMPFDFGSFVEALADAFDVRGSAAAFRSAFDLREAGKSFAAGFRDGATSATTQMRNAIDRVRRNGPYHLAPKGHLRLERLPADPIDHDGAAIALQRILAVWKARLANQTFESLSRQLPYLLEEEEQRQTADTVSFEALLTYLATRRWIKAPSLTMARNGVFVANWRPMREAKARLSIDFLDKKRARWSVVDAREADAPTMIGGICSIAEVDAHLLIYKSWLRR